MPLTADDITLLYRTEARRLAGFFVSRTHDPEVAMDLVAETFAIVIEDRRRFRGERATPAAWMYGIATNLLTSWYRRGAVERRAMQRLGIETPHLDEHEHDRLVELAGLAEQREQVAAQMRALPEDQRRAVELRIVDEQPYDEVARVLGITQQTARSRVSRGLRALANSLSEAPAHG